MYWAKYNAKLIIFVKKINISKTENRGKIQKFGEKI
jgi:hypothetical protein